MDYVYSSNKILHQWNIKNTKIISLKSKYPIFGITLLYFVHGGVNTNIDEVYSVKDGNNEKIFFLMSSVIVRGSTLDVRFWRL